MLQLSKGPQLPETPVANAVPLSSVRNNNVLVHQDIPDFIKESRVYTSEPYVRLKMEVEKLTEENEELKEMNKEYHYNLGKRDH